MLGIVRLYSPKVRERLTAVLEEYLVPRDSGAVLDQLMSVLDELIKNAIKGNYKFVLLREAIELAIAAKDLDLTIDKVLRDRALIEEITTKYVNVTAVVDRVRQALTEESQYVNLRNKAKTEDRPYTSAEVASLAKLHAFREIRRKLEQYGTRVEIRIAEFWGALNVEVTNTAPIMSWDLDRILTKRAEFRRYADEGREMEFFINNIDNLDGGAGLGYATIDSQLRNLGFDPNQALSLLTVTNTTASLGLKLDTLAKAAAAQEISK